MDKYEFNIKVEQIKKLVNKGDFETAMKIADTIDWRRVRSTSLLTMISQIYEKNAEYQDAKDILLLAYERAPLGKGLLYKLTDLALRENNIQEAEAYYREFCELSGDDPRQYLLRFLILEAKDAPLEQQINSLERYCQEELDEKWLYHLAELYHQANQADDCVRICDKIMLMFGLGKYVDKAMELKLQYAPLTKYQMDLVENREKYEEKLRAVEEEYKNGTYRKPEPEEEYLDTDEPEAELDDEPENEPEGQPEQAEPEEKAGKPKAETKPADEKVEKAALDEDVVASLHEAQAEEALAKEVSKIKPYDEEEGASEGETRVFRNLRDLEPAEAEEKSEEAPIHEFEEEEETIVEDWDFEPEEEEEEIKESNHLMIEAEDPAAGLAMALDSLKKIHRELGTKHPVAKISGANLSHRGIASVAERLAGKDLVVEHAADLDDLTVEELEELMTQDETGMVVVLIDTQARLEQMHRAYPALAVRFQYIGCENQKDDAAKLAQAREEELKRQQAQQEAEAARKRQAEREAEIRRQAEKEAEEKRRQQEAAARREEEERAKEEAQALAAKEAEEARKAEEDRRLAERQREELRRQEEARRDDEPEYEDEEDHYEKDEYEPEDDYARGGYRDDYKDDYKDSYKDEREDDEYSNYPEDEPEEKPSKKSGDMDVEEFVQYACKYASEIDCSISGKSMLALYERAEMMEEDGEPLTKTSAEDLIEEAADKAEKKSFSGLFSSKYDKDGLLILKEKHFFD
ncbi:procyclic acidic repetitive family protein [uncultured Clostridium sp.]|uniref:procyclic acidic repetitive family protein n=1 Tax=uncultured Clostridium sp. TaxID=59620 RepID=UPI002665C4F2|nr:procyclic acidic repetitive family protein [uncultured Clostridium sp.]